MKQLSIFVLIATLIPAFSMGSAFAQNSRQSTDTHLTRDVANVMTPDGPIELSALRETGYQGALDLRDVKTGINPITVPPIGSFAPQLTGADDPDDVYWDNSMSPAMPGINGVVRATAIYHGELIAAGTFTLAGDTPVNNIAAWDGNSWSALGSGIPGEAVAIFHLIVYEDRLIAAGIPWMAEWDGQSWTPFGPDLLSMRVNAVAVYDGKLFVGGYFGDGTSSHNLAAWDGSSWSLLETGMQNVVDALVVYQNKLIAGGTFSAAGGHPANRIAAWDGQSWSALGSGLDTYPTIMAVYEDRLIAACGRESRDSHLYAWDGTSWSTLVDSLVISALSVYEGQLIVGGYFTSIGGVDALRIASWDGDTWHPLGQGAGLTVIGLTVFGDQLVAGGIGLATVNGAPASAIEAWDGTSWSRLSPPTVGLDQGVSDLAVYRDDLIVSGGFHWAGDVSVNGLASWDGRHWSPMARNIGPVRVLATFHDRLYAASNDRGRSWYWSAASIASWDGNTWSDPDTSINASVKQFIAYDGQLIALGEQIGGIEWTFAYPSLFAWDGSTWPELYSFGALDLYAMAVYDRKLFLGGSISFGAEYPANRFYLKAWDGEALSELTPELRGYILCMIEYDHLLVVGGSLAGLGGDLIHGIAAWDGSSWLPLAEGIDGAVWALAVHDGKLIAGGSFTAAGGAPASNIAEWDGHAWSALGSGTNGRVTDLIEYAGDLVVAGDFITSGDKTSPYLSLWTKHEARKVTLDIRPGSCVNPINGNSAHGQGKAVIPVAIMGTADFDVHDIDPATINLKGASPVRWNYEDVGAPPDNPDEECACSEASPDGYADLKLKFYSAEVVASLDGGNVVRIEGKLYDGSAFEGRNCVTLVDHYGGKAADMYDEEREFELMGNSPNPFNPTTRISFYLPESAPVQLEIFNVLGQKVATLVDKTLEAGEHAVIWDGSQAASGIYFYRLQVERQVQSHKMLLIK